MENFVHDLPLPIDLERGEQIRVAVTSPVM
jgi:hypothetical protein